MVSGRSMSRATASAAWRENALLSGLQSALLAAPEHATLPMHIRAAVDTALRCAATAASPSVSTAIAAAATAAGGAAEAAAAAAAATATARGIAAAVEHIYTALALVPASVAHAAHSLAHAMLLMSTAEWRAVVGGLGAATDDLALPATWQTPLTFYTAVTHSLGWVPLLVNSLMLLDTLCAMHGDVGTAVTNGTGHNGTKAQQHTLGKKGFKQQGVATASPACRLLQLVLQADPALAWPVFNAMWLPAAAAAATAGGDGCQAVASVPAPAAADSQLPDRSWRATCTVLDAMWAHQGMQAAAGTTAAAATATQTAQSVLALSTCAAACWAWLARAGASGGPVGSDARPVQDTAAEPADAAADAHAAARRTAQLLDAQLSSLLSQLQPSAAPAWASPAPLLTQLRSCLRSLLATIEQQSHHAGTVAGLVELAPRIKSLVSALQGISAAGNYDDSITHAHQPVLSVPCCNWYDSSSSSGDQAAGATAPRKAAAAAWLTAVSGRSRGWQAAARMPIPRLSQHGLPAALMRALDSYHHVTTFHTGTLYIPDAHACKPHVKPPSQPSAWEDMCRRVGVTSDQVREQVVCGWVLATLTPGLPCSWQSLNNTKAVHEAEDADCYGPMRVGLACMELAACVELAAGSAGMAPQDKDGDSGDRGLWLPCQPGLRDVLLGVAVSAMRDVESPAQQLAVQQAVHSTLVLSRLVAELAEDDSVTQSSTAALIAASNQLVIDSAAKHLAGTAVSAERQQQAVATAARDLLPFAILTPHQLLARAVADCLQHPGQLPFWFQLLQGPLRPTALAQLPHRHTHSHKHAPTARIPGHVTTDNKDDDNNGRSATLGPSSVALCGAISDYVLQQCKGPVEATMPDGQLRALGALLAACVGQGSGSGAGTAGGRGAQHGGGPLPVRVVVREVVVPLLGWCSTLDRLPQARTMLTLAHQVLSGNPPTPSTGGSQAPAYTLPCGVADLLGSPAPLAQGSSGTQAHVPDQPLLVSLVTALAGLLQQLYDQASQDGVLYPSAIELAVLLIESVVHTASSAITTQPKTPPDLPLASARHLLSSHPISHSPALLSLFLPLIQTSLAAARRTATDSETAEQEAADLTTQLMQRLAPMQPARMSAAQAEQALAESMQALVWLAAADSDQARLVIECFREWAGEEYKEACEESHDSIQDASAAAHTRWCEAMGCLRWSMGQLRTEGIDGGDGGGAGGARGVARSCARRLQRNLVRHVPEAAPALPRVLARLLPVLSSSQALRVLLSVAPCVLVSASASQADDLGHTNRSWVQTQATSYTSAAASDGAIFAAKLTQSAANTGTGAAADRETSTAAVGSTAVYCARVVQAVCLAIREHAEAGQTQSAARCVQHLVALVSRYLTADTASSAASADAGAGADGAASAGTERAWLSAVLMLPDLLACWRALEACGLGTEVLQVALLNALGVILRTPTALVPTPTPELQNTETPSPTAALVCVQLGELPYTSLVQCVGCVLNDTGGNGAAAGEASLGAVRMAALQIAEQHLTEVCAGNDGLLDACMADIEECLG